MIGFELPKNLGTSGTFQIVLVADDTSLLYADSNLKSLEKTVNSELLKVSDWLNANKLTLNAKKSNYVIFRPYQRIYPDSLFSYLTIIILSVMTAVTFPLRPPRLAFAICGWRWQNDVHEIKYSVCSSSGNMFGWPYGKELGVRIGS